MEIRAPRRRYTRALIRGGETPGWRRHRMPSRGRPGAFRSVGTDGAEADLALFASVGCDVAELARLRNTATATVRAQLAGCLPRRAMPRRIGQSLIWDLLNGVPVRAARPLSSASLPSSGESGIVVPANFRLALKTASRHGGDRLAKADKGHREEDSADDRDGDKLRPDHLHPGAAK